MAEFDFDRAVRWAGLRRKAALARRGDSELPYATDALPGPALLLDTCVYIDRLQGRLPPLADALLDLRISNHSSVGLSELTFAVGRLDPADGRTRATIDAIGALVATIRPYRLFHPDADVSGRAALLAGVLARIQSHGKDDRLRAWNDCLLFLQATKLGLTVLTRNVRDFDLLLQLVPAGRVLFYREA